MTINGRTYSLDGIVTAGPRTRAACGLVLSAVLVGPRGAVYTLDCWDTGRATLYDARLRNLAYNPEVTP